MLELKKLNRELLSYFKRALQFKEKDDTAKHLIIDFSVRNSWMSQVDDF